MYKSKLKNAKNLFGTELVFETEDKNDIAGLAVEVNRPALNLESLLYYIWQHHDQFNNIESQSDLKVLYIVFQIATLVVNMIVRNKLVHGGLCMRSFYVDLVSLEVRLTNFAFCRKALGG